MRRLSRSKVKREARTEECVAGRTARDVKCEVGGDRLNAKKRLRQLCRQAASATTNVLWRRPSHERRRGGRRWIDWRSRPSSFFATPGTTADDASSKTERRGKENSDNNKHGARLQAVCLFISCSRGIRTKELRPHPASITNSADFVCLTRRNPMRKTRLLCCQFSPQCSIGAGCERGRRSAPLISRPVR